VLPFLAAAVPVPVYPSGEATGDDVWFNAAYIAIAAVVLFVILAVLLRKTAVGKAITAAVLVATVAFIAFGYIGITVEAREISVADRAFVADVTTWLQEDYDITVGADQSLAARVNDGVVFGATQGEGETAIKLSIKLVRGADGQIELLDSLGKTIPPK
jgi:hypothetical protein